VSRAVAVSLAGLVEGRVAEDDGVAERPGAGLQWEHEGRTYRFGRRPDGAHGDGDAIVSVFTAGDEELAALSFLEEIRPDATAETAHLRASGLEVHLLSGDRSEKVAAVATALDIDPSRAHAGLAPGDKAAHVRRLDQNDTLMVGDGINDGPSFDAALCAATPAIDRPARPARADFYFLGEGISAVRRALGAARQLRSVVRGNLAVAVCYNLGALALCYAGRIDPLTAAVLMPISSITVVGITAWRLTGRRLTWRY
jgi:Cu2+-exporting ATPase